MSLSLKSEPIPIREEPSGALRIGESRVLLELGINAFKDGETPETIVQRYSTLRLPDVYSVLAYDLRHRAEVESYLRQRERQADDLRQRIASGQRDLTEIRQRLLSQRNLANIGTTPCSSPSTSATATSWSTSTAT